MYIWICIPCMDGFEECIFGNGGCILEFLKEGEHTAISAGFLFHTDVGLGVGAIAHEHDGQSWLGDGRGGGCR